MSTFLQILGVILLVLVLIVGLAILTLLLKFRRFAKTARQFLEELGQSSATPAKVTLERMATATWSDAKAIGRTVEPLPDLGFEQVGTFQVAEIDGLQLQAWIQPKEDVTAVVYEHPQAGVWLDLVTRYADGTRWTYANTSQGSGVDHQPGHTVERFPGVDTRGLYQKHLADRDSKPREKADPATFVAVFEKAYSDEMEWRNSRGGPTEEEIHRIAALANDTYDERVLRGTRQALQAHALDQLNDSLRERFLEESNVLAAEQERLRDRLVIIHDMLSLDAIEETLSDWLDREFDSSHFEDAPPRVAFAAFNLTLPVEERFHKLGELEEPIDADVYRGPEVD